MAGEAWEDEFDPEMDAETFILQYELDDRAAASLRSSPEEVVRGVISEGPPTGENPSAQIMARVRQMSEDTAQDWDTFISVVDDRAKEVFAAQSQELIQAVMEEGPLNGSNPSAILMARIRKAGGTQNSGRRVAKSKVPNGSAQTVVRGGRQPHVKAGQASSSSESQSGLHGLGLALCKLNNDMWNFDVPAATVIATFKNVLKKREATVAAAQATPAQSGEWPEWAEDEPRKKKAKQEEDEWPE
mmetsp:Transcript_93791/g.186024  ORF Transcript_93791/g.186024 Transcript_93791/m.186024 type:complete len:244 (+) Transcript_93791:71-802(+)